MGNMGSCPVGEMRRGTSWKRPRPIKKLSSRSSASWRRWRPWPCFRTLFTRQTRLEQAVSAAEQAVEAGERELEKVSGERARLETTLAEATRELERTEAEAQGMEPDLAEARALDQRLEELADRRQEAEERADEARLRLDERATDANQATSALEDLLREMAELQEWFAAHRSDERVYEEWVPRRRALLQLVSLFRDLEAGSARLDALVRENKNGEGEVREAVGRLEQNLQGYREAERDFRQAREALGTFDAATLRERRDYLERHRDLLRRNLDLQEEETRGNDERRRAGDEIDEIEGMIAVDRAERDQIAADLDRRRIQRDEAQRAARLAEAALDLSARRGDLLFPGRPCPLCGSTDHPHRRKAGPVRQVASELGRRAAELDAEVRRSEQKETSLITRLEENGKRLQRMQHRRADLEEAARRLADQREAARRELGEHEALSAWLSTREGLSDELARVLEGLELVRGEQAAGEDAGRRLESARAALDEQSRLLELAKDQRRNAEQASRLVAEQLRAVRAELDVSRAQQRASLDDLAPLFPDLERLEREGEAYMEEQARRVEAYRTRRERQGDLATRRRGLEERATAAREAVSRERGVLEPLEAACRQWAVAAEETRQRRGELLKGRSVEVVVQRLREAHSRAVEAEQEAREILAEATRRGSALEESRRHAAADLNGRREEAASLQAELHEALGRESLSEQRIRELAARDEEWDPADPGPSGRRP